MLQLKGIKKNYLSGENTVHALKGVSINFRANEFVSILGQSGCGKTTLLNIIGGLDQYTEGDLIIKGRSTKEYKDKDWDTYRNNSIGFVFQSYNLIMHQSVLSNVELALTLSGVSKSERRRRAKEVLEKVGLGNQMHKKPNQMSGGQMQRVAIARALINDPEILLADEPTGALDTETSVQIMDLLKDIAKDRLVIMVTHNPELAEKYSTRIVKLLDGEIIDDSMPYSDEEVAKEEYPVLTKKEMKKQMKHNRMSYLTALSLSFNNLLTKKGRTILTSFAGSIGIIGIALILSLSDGFNNYIKDVEENTLSTYPLEITDATVDMSSMMGLMLGTDMESTYEHDMDKIYSNNFVGDYMETMMGEVKINDMKSFMDYIENGDGSVVKDYSSDIMYMYGITVNAYKKDTNSEIYQVNPACVFESIGMGSMSQMSEMTSVSSMNTTNVWSEMISNQELLDSQYDVIAGRWPEKYDEVILVVSEKNEITDYELYALGLRDITELQEMMKAAFKGESVSFPNTSYTYDELLGLEYQIIPSSDFFEYNESKGVFEDKSNDAVYMKNKIDNGINVKVVGIVRPNEDAKVHSITTTIGYRHELTEKLMTMAKESEVGKAQVATPDIDVFTGYKFGEEIPEVDLDELQTATNEMMESFDVTQLTDEQKKAMGFEGMSDEEIMAAMQESTVQMTEELTLSDLQSTTEATYDDNLIKIGIAYEEKPKVIRIYPKDFEAKEKIIDVIEEYNKNVKNSGEDDKEITYNDYVGTMMSSISTIINAISYVLMAFVAISLVVSSIMIGIITYISVLERTKEIGVLRSIGASKKDISRVFNAETIIIGLFAGLMGVLVTVLLNIPINMIIYEVSGLNHIAKLPLVGAIILVVISVILTTIGGLIPSRIASKKDPVEALRSE